MARLSFSFIKISFSCSHLYLFLYSDESECKKDLVVQDLLYETSFTVKFAFSGYHAYSLHFAQFGVFRTTIPIGARKLNVAHLPRVLNVYIALSVRVPQATFVTMICDPQQIWHNVGSARAVGCWLISPSAVDLEFPVPFTFMKIYHNLISSLALTSESPS